MKKKRTDINMAVQLGKLSIKRSTNKNTSFEVPIHGLNYKVLLLY